MKKVINKNTIFTFILGIIISGVTVYAVTYNANQINFTPTNNNWKKQDGTNITNVQDALNSLYDNKKSSNNVIFVGASWKYASNWGRGFSFNVLSNDDYIEFSDRTVKFKKAGKVKITVFIDNTDTSSTNPMYKLYKDNEELLSLTNGKSENDYKKESIVVDVEKDSSIYPSMYGAKIYTYGITVFELVDD